MLDHEFGKFANVENYLKRGFNNLKKIYDIIKNAENDIIIIRQP